MVPFLSFINLSDSIINFLLEIENRCYDNPWSRENLIFEVHRSNSINFAICFSEKIIGYCFNYYVFEEMFITNICIHPDFRNRGFGFVLLNHIIKKAADIDVKIIHLEVRYNNANAIRLYKSVGFSENCVRKNYYSNGDDAILMEMILS